MYISKLFGSLKQDPEKAQIIRNLLQGIWGFESPGNLPKSKATSCVRHYETLLGDQRLLNDDSTTLRESKTPSADVITLITKLRRDTDKSLDDIRKGLQTTNTPAWLIDTAAVDEVLTFASRLWLFTRLDFTDGQRTLAKAARAELDKISGASTNAFVYFSADILTKAGLHIKWTSELSEHLTFASNSFIRVFSHASVLERYEGSMERDIYPDGFLKEVQRTLNLLWPTEDPALAKRVRTKERKENVDIEAKMSLDEKLNLSTYPIFGERLFKIQMRLEAVQTRRGASRGFQIAIYGILLTAFFGLVSAITGIMQVRATCRAYPIASPTSSAT